MKAFRSLDRRHRSPQFGAACWSPGVTVTLLVVAHLWHSSAIAETSDKKWVASWASSMQGAYVYSPPAPLDSPFHLYAINPDLRFAFPDATTDGAVEQTFRLIVKPDLFGENYRLRFSNFFGTQAVTFKAISVAVQDYAGNIIPDTLRKVTFGHADTVTIQPGELVYSDGFKSPADPDDPLLKGRNFAVSFAVQGKSGPMTCHTGDFTTSYISPPNSGDHTEDIHDFAFPNSTTAVFFLDALDVLASADTTVVCAFGDSITDGTFSTINGNDRWSNDLSIRLHEAYGNKVSVVNEGIGGNTVVNPLQIGPAAVNRLDRDVLGLSGLTSVVWLEGINDFGAENNTASAVIAGLQDGINRMHAAGIKVVGATITSGLNCTVLPNWGTPATDAKRRATNDFIRNSGRYDSVADMDAATLDPGTGELKPEFVPDTSIGSPGDKLHPNRAGYQSMANTVDLKVLVQAPSPSSTTQATTPSLLRDKLTQVLPDRHVTFRLLAPKANTVDVVIGIKSGPYEPQGSTTAAMTKDANGLWSVTLGPLEPNLYEYQFSLDGCKMTDPGNDMPKPQRQVDTSLLLIPASPPDFLDVQNGAHGTVRDETYYSTALGKNRRVLVYTPPTYDRSHTPLPVLYLYHGFWDTRYSWVTEGRLAQILDNLLAEGKAVPMIVVVPEAHALPPEDVPGTDHTAYLAKNQQAVDEELFHDIIPLIVTHYNISDEPRDRAIAGLSMGGLQAIETGIVHLGYFRWIGAFSPGVRPAALSDEFKNALEDGEKINKDLLLFDIAVGDDDKVVGKDVTKFEDQLKQANVQHVYTLLPSGTHSMFVWRPALYSFLQQVFKR
jgi:enterochelin esterase-like enzyme/lysophospholipase L1-like esterase